MLTIKPLRQHAPYSANFGRAGAVLAAAMVLIMGHASPVAAQIFTRDGGGGSPAGGKAEGGRGMPDPERIMQLDRNGDGLLAPEEMPERMRSRVERIDTDGDGMVSKAELTTAFERIREHRAQNGAGGFGGPGGAGKGQGRSPDADTAMPYTPPTGAPPTTGTAEQNNQAAPGLPVTNN